MDQSRNIDPEISSWEETFKLAQEFALDSAEALNDHRTAAAQVFATLAQTYATLASSLVADENLLWLKQTEIELKRIRKKMSKKSRWVVR